MKKDQLKPSCYLVPPWAPYDIRCKHYSWALFCVKGHQFQAPYAWKSPKWWACLYPFVGIPGCLHQLIRFCVRKESSWDLRKLIVRKYHCKMRFCYLDQLLFTRQVGQQNTMFEASCTTQNEELWLQTTLYPLLIPSKLYKYTFRVSFAIFVSTSPILPSPTRT